jgi:integrase/recombinase XerD
LTEHNQDHLPSKHQSPWLPTDDQWLTFLQVIRHEPLRNQVMILLAYEAALRSSELLALCVSDIDLAQRTVSIRAETTKTHQVRVVIYPESIHDIIAAYVTWRYQAGNEHSPLFPSDSSLNPGRPMLHATWSKIVKELALRVGVPQFSTYTFRRKRLDDLFSA